MNVCRFLIRPLYLPKLRYFRALFVPFLSLLDLSLQSMKVTDKQYSNKSKKRITQKRKWDGKRKKSK